MAYIDINDIMFMYTSQLNRNEKVVVYVYGVETCWTCGLIHNNCSNSVIFIL